MTDPQRATTEQKCDPRPEAARVWLLGGFRVSVGSRSIGEEEWHLKKAGSLPKTLCEMPLETLTTSIRRLSAHSSL